MKKFLPVLLFGLLCGNLMVFSQSEATYSINYTSTWSETTHPHPGGNFPASAHYSKLVGATHNDQVVFLEMGSLATPGIEDIAELGSNGVFFSEVNTAISNGAANEIIDGDDLSSSTGEINISNVVTNEDFPLLTLVSMIAPSPDWMIAVNSVELLDTNGDWKPSISIDLFPYDAGTDSGVDYTSPNLDTDPPEPISSAQGVAPFSNEKMGTLTITLESVLGNDDNSDSFLQVFPNPTDGIIRITESKGIKSVEVFNVLGAKVLQQNINSNQVQMDISSLRSGLYMFRIESSDGTSVVKKVIKR
ncbi:MAG: spondin domain-containing protein [Bacteroidia bacterium]|nr:spondin domain-containing protein [Bacteroidia bacterium]NNF31903.1 T9SS type A sorting domain-containing protein [Flavobacteriaceae bacterium]NNJ81178.1 T9SS type A sorting domain-containing protein [Flavobacteriaceae bacterium]NNK53591.1 T9SS type A sorting domain-containing protein [Flavobacteriaceae bacterium]